jgi:hypothetical protein
VNLEFLLSHILLSVFYGFYWMINSEASYASIIYLSSLILAFYSIIILIQSCWQGNFIGSSPSTMDVQMDGSEDAQPSIVAEEDLNESAEVDEEDELSSN